MALRTKDIKTRIDDIPSNWLFEYYCGLNQKLHGQEIKIKSMWNRAEKVPSMSIFYCPNRKQYRFKDFSSGKSGNGIDLVAGLFDLSIKASIVKIFSDYNTRKDDKKVLDIVPESKYKVTSHTKRKWNQLDAAFWMDFEIGSDDLAEYNVIALDKYSLTRELDGQIQEVEIKGQYLYGFFRKDGSGY